MTKTMPLTREEIVAMACDLDDAAVSVLLAIGPSAEELAEALAWAEGEDDVMGELEIPLTCKVAQIYYDILTADEDEEEQRTSYARCYPGYPLITIRGLRRATRRASPARSVAEITSARSL